MGIWAGYKLNIKSLMTNKTILVLFVCCQIVGFVALLLSVSYILHIDAMYYEDAYKMRLDGQITYGECVDKLYSIQFRQATVYLDEERIFAVTFQENTGVTYGREINHDEYEALVSQDMEGAEIGNEIQFDDITYKIVGFAAVSGNYVELSKKAIDKYLAVYDMDIINPSISKRKTEEFADMLKNLFECEVKSPEYVPFSEKIAREPYYAIIGVGILGISAVTMILCYRYMFVKRNYNYMVERCIGADRNHLFIAMLLEVLTVVGITMIVASLIYLILERTLFTKIFIYLFGNINYLGIGYYLVIFFVFAIMCILSALPVIIKLMSKKVVR